MYIGHTCTVCLYCVAVQKLITFIDIRSGVFCSNVMENNCNIEL